MNILLTGGIGYIGSHASVVLANAGHKVIIVDNLSNSTIDVFRNVKKISKNSLEFVQGCVTNTPFLISTLEKYEIQAVMHFAGYKSVSDSTSYPLSYYRNNVFGAISLLEAMSKVNLTRIIFSSSATVYGNPVYLPCDENHPLNPVNTYGKTKLTIERMLDDLCFSNQDWKVISLRYFNPIGAHEDGLIGENTKDEPNNLMPYITRVASEEYPYLSIFGDDYLTTDGTGVRDYIHVMDLAEGHMKALDYLDQVNGHEFFNLGLGRGVSVLELVKTFEDVNKLSIKFRVTKRRAGDIAESYSDISKSRKVLGWEPKRNLDEMCFSAWNFQKKLNN